MAFINYYDCRLCEIRLTGPLACCEERFFIVAIADLRFWVIAPKFYFVLIMTSGGFYYCFVLLCC